MLPLPVIVVGFLVEILVAVRHNIPIYGEALPGGLAKASVLQAASYNPLALSTLAQRVPPSPFTAVGNVLPGLARAKGAW